MNTAKHLWLSVLFSVFFFALSAQDSVMLNYPLKHHITPQERAAMKNWQRDFTETDPPEGTVRNIAEWESMESVLIAYDGGFGIPYSAIAEMSQDCQVTTLVANASEENTVRSYFSSNGVNLDNCNFIYHDVDSWWVRDYSPWYIAVDETEIAAINFPYNRPRPNDDDTPISVSQTLGLDLYGMNLIHTGGNYMTDGYGISASTDLVLEEAGMTEELVHQKVLDYLGVETYHITLDPLGDYIRHIDCWGKFLAPDKILITQVPQSDSRYEDYEAVAQYFANENCAYGYPYEVIRVQAAAENAYDVNPYTNSLILNEKVFVPVSGSSYDAAALEVYEQAMPGYEIIAVQSYGWYNSDALHCRTHGIADREMLHIAHIPLRGVFDYQTTYTITADVSNYGLPVSKTQTVDLHYKIGDNEWQSSPMIVDADNYSATLSAPEGDFTLSYYISASNDNGKSAIHPFAGELDPHSFSYTAPVSLPQNTILQTSVYPNPTRGLLFVKTNQVKMAYTLRNTAGSIVREGVLNDDRSKIDLSNLSSGIYFLEMRGDEERCFEKIIKR